MPAASLRFKPIVREGYDSFVEVGIVFRNASRVSGVVNFQVLASSTATRGPDFTGEDGQVFYDFQFDTPGDIYLPLRVYDLKDDLISEASERLIVSVNAPNWTFDNARDTTNAIITIIDNDSPAGRPSNDYNGDGRSDILWREANGAFTTWLGRPDGMLVNNDAAAFVSGVTVDWKVAGSGDFNGDGRSDVLWRNDDGRFTTWLGRPDGGLANNDAAAFVAGVTPNWRVAGVDDFNGDGRADILWRSDDGYVSDWLGRPDGGVNNNDAAAFAFVPTDWKISGTGDFNGDGRADVLWRNDDGRITNWLGRSDGGFTNNDAAALRAVPSSWRVVGTGDFNGDGRSDLAWRNSDGSFSNWLGRENGDFIINDALAFTSKIPISWKVADTGDYNGDGRFDLLWRDTNGSVATWLGREDGGYVGTELTAFATVPLNWQIQNNYPLV